MPDSGDEWGRPSPCLVDKAWTGRLEFLARWSRRLSRLGVTLLLRLAQFDEALEGVFDCFVGFFWADPGVGGMALAFFINSLF